MSAPTFMDTPTLMIRSPSSARYIKASTTDILRASAAITAGTMLPRGNALESPAATRRWLLTNYAARPAECFGAMFLDNRHRLIRVQELFQGTVDGASVHPREVVKAALEVNAAAVVLFHNHPSGVSEPSQADEMITLRLRDALALVDIRVLDHLIVGGDRVTSLAERGVL